MTKIKSYESKLFPVYVSGMGKIMPLLGALDSISDIAGSIDKILTTGQMVKNHIILSHSDFLDCEEVYELIINFGHELSDEELNQCLRAYLDLKDQFRKCARNRISHIQNPGLNLIT